MGGGLLGPAAAAALLTQHPSVAGSLVPLPSTLPRALAAATAQPAGRGLLLAATSSATSSAASASSMAAAGARRLLSGGGTIAARRPLLTAALARAAAAGAVSGALIAAGSPAAPSTGALPPAVAAALSGSAQQLPGGPVEVDVGSVALAVQAADVGEGEWNEQYQRLLERPEASVAGAAAKAVALAAFAGRFAAAAGAAAGRIAEELGLPPHLRSIPPMGAAEGQGQQGGSAEEVFYHRGIFLRVSQQQQPAGRSGFGLLLGNGGGAGAADAPASPADYVSLPSSAEVIQRKVAGHELRGVTLLAEAAAAALQEWQGAAALADPASAAAAAPPPALPCTALTALVDVGGYRVYAMAVPPMDDARTLVYGRLEGGPEAPFVARSPTLAGALRRAARFLNLKPHAVEVRAFGPSSHRPGSAEAAAVCVRTSGGEVASEDPSSLGTRTLVIPLSLDAQAHQCEDRRFYVLNAARLMPADLPLPSAEPSASSAAHPFSAASAAADAAVCALRPELLRRLDRPLSADAFRSDTAAAALGLAPAPGGSIGSPPDAQGNDMDAARASQWLLGAVLPAFVAAVEGGDPAAAPTDSHSLTRAMHAAGINMRYLGRVAALAASPWLRELAEAEMVARVAKHVMHSNARRVARQVAAATSVASSSLALTSFSPASGGVGPLSPHRAMATLRSHASLLVREASAACADLLNLLLGTSADSLAFWRDIVLLSVERKFAYTLRWPEELAAAGRTPTHKPLLFTALQYHCGVACTPDALPLPAALPSCARTATAQTADSVATALSVAAKGIATAAFRAPLPPAGSGAVGDGEGATATLYAHAPGAAPVVYTPTTPGLGVSALGSPALPAALLPRRGGGSGAAGAAHAFGAPSPSSAAAAPSPPTAAPLYDFSRPEPVSAADFLPPQPAVACAPLRPLRLAGVPQGSGLAGVGAAALAAAGAAAEVECGVLAESAREHAAAGRTDDAFAALQLRLAILTAAAAGGAGGPSCAADTCLTLLEIGSLLLRQRDLAGAHAAAEAVLERVSGRHVLAARALMLRARALVAAGEEDAGLAVYAQAAEAATWHVGKGHPLLVELACAAGCMMALAGRPGVGAPLLESAADMGMRCLGHRHPTVAAAAASAGCLYRAAAAAAAMQAGPAMAVGSSSGAGAASAGGLSASLSLLDFAGSGFGSASRAGGAGGASSDGDVAALARLHSSAYLARAVECYERALVLLESSSSGSGGSSGTAGSAAAVAEVCAALADALASQGKLHPALATARKALELRRAAAAAPGTPASPALLHSLQQLAALHDRLNEPLEAIRHGEALLAGLRLPGSAPSEAQLQAVQRGLRHVLRLTLRALPGSQRSVLHTLTAARGGTASAAAVTFVARSLLAARKPSDFVRQLSQRALAAVAGGVVSVDSTNTLVASASVTHARIGEPDILDQLAAVVSLLASPAEGGEGEEQPLLEPLEGSAIALPHLGRAATQQA
jgi:tetratricopeptide (TPR) repeat protein